MTLPCVNITHNTSEDSLRYFLLESEHFDKFLLFKILQILLYCLAIYIRIVVDLNIFYIILEKEQLQTCANTAIVVFLISDLLLIIHHTAFAFVILLSETLWIYKPVGYMEAFLNNFFGIFNYLSLTVLTLEKFLYTNYPFKHLKYFNIKKTITYMTLCIIPTAALCISIHAIFPVRYISNTLSMFYCFKETDVAGKHLFWVIPVFLIILIMYCHITILVDLCHDQCHIPQLPGFTLHRMDIDFVGRFVRAAVSVVILTTIVFVDLLLRILFQYVDTPVHFNRCVWILSIILRIFNPLIILGGNPPLRNYVYNSGFHRSPSWLLSKAMIEKSSRNRSIQH